MSSGLLEATLWNGCLLLPSGVRLGPMYGEVMGRHLQNHRGKPWLRGSRGRYWKAHEHC
jgi:hypothetical protein